MMLPNDRAKSAARGKPDWFASVASWAAGAPLWLKIVLVVPALLLSPVIAVIA
jgi:hypothetical protein